MRYGFTVKRQDLRGTLGEPSFLSAKLLSQLNLSFSNHNMSRFSQMLKSLTLKPCRSQLCYVMPSSSARCAQFPRAQDKVHYYIKLKDLRDQLKGIERNTDIQEVQYTFDLQLAQGLFHSLPLSVSHVYRTERKLWI